MATTYGTGTTLTYILPQQGRLVDGWPRAGALGANVMYASTLWCHEGRDGVFLLVPPASSWITAGCRPYAKGKQTTVIILQNKFSTCFKGKLLSTL